MIFFVYCLLLSVLISVCARYLLEYILNLIATRPTEVTDKYGMRRWYLDPATWIELVSMATCVAELALVSAEAGSVAYTVWGMPYLASFSSAVMRPLRIVVMIRLCVMMRGVASMKILVRTMKETYQRLMVPIFFLLVLGLIFAGLIYTFETLLQCYPVAECSDGSTDLTQCPGQDAFVDSGIGTVVYYRHASDVNSGPSKDDLCMLQNMWDAIWVSFVTISTVGYGVLYPVTSAGKGVAMIAASCGIMYLAMPLSIVGGRFYSIYEEFEKVASLRKAKAKFRHAVGAVFTVNLQRGGLAQAIRRASRTNDVGPLRAEIREYERLGKSRTARVYKDAIKTAVKIEDELTRKHLELQVRYSSVYEWW